MEILCLLYNLLHFLTFDYIFGGEMHGRYFKIGRFLSCNAIQNNTCIKHTKKIVTK